MRVVHPKDPWRSKDIPDAEVEKYLAGGWTLPESKPKRRTPAKSKK